MKNTIFTVIIAVLASFTTYKFLPGGEGVTLIDKKETAYERVMRTGKIRCGYGLYYPYMMKNPNTSEFSGVFYDYTEALGKELSLEIEWVEETGWADYPTALETRRIDAFCAGAWITPSRTRVLDYVTPITYQPNSIAVKAGNDRFDGDLSTFNNPDVTFAQMEGTAELVAVETHFSKARILVIPSLSSVSESFESVESNKADAFLVGPATIHDYQSSNPGVIKMLQNVEIASFHGEAISIMRGEGEFRQMLSNTTLALINSGRLDPIIKKYEVAPGSIYLAKPYKEK